MLNKIILASKSKVRKEILDKNNIESDVIPSNVDEDIVKESLIKEIFTICKSGKRSEKASKILSKFKIQSRSIEGGIDKIQKIL